MSDTSAPFVPTPTETFRRKYLEIIFTLNSCSVVVLEHAGPKPLETFDAFFQKLLTSSAGVAVIDQADTDGKVRLVCWSDEFAYVAAKTVEAAGLKHDGHGVIARVSQTRPSEWPSRDRIEVHKTSTRLWNPPTLNPAHPNFDPDPILRLHPSQCKTWRGMCNFLRVPMLGLFDERLEGQPMPSYNSGIVAERLGLVGVATESGPGGSDEGEALSLNPADPTSYAVRVELAAPDLQHKRAFVDYVNQYQQPKFAGLSEDWFCCPFGVATFASAAEAASLTYSINSDMDSTRARIWDPADPLTQVKVTYALEPLDEQAVRLFVDHSRPRTGYAPIAFRQLQNSTVLLYESTFAASSVAATMDRFRPDQVQDHKMYYATVTDYGAVNFSTLLKNLSHRRLYCSRV